MIAENKRFQMDDSIIYADLDIGMLDIQRQKKNSFRGMAPDGTSASEYSGLYSRMDIGAAAPTDFSKKLYRKVEPHPFLPEGDALEIAKRSREILRIQATGLAARMEHIGCRKAVIGVSGGLDSTLALIVAAMAFERLGIPRSEIIGITMPGLGTTSRTKSNAVELMEAIGITSREISVVPAVEQHFKDIGHNPAVMDSTYENAQARERTQILMDIANQENGIVIGTGDLSELALGWCTYNGDHMSMYAVNASVPKTLVKFICKSYAYICESSDHMSMYGANASVPKTLIKHLVRWAANNLFDGAKSSTGRSASEILMDVTETPISPELMPAHESGEIKQKTEDLIGPYELHDFFIYNFMKYGFSPSKIYFLACQAFCPSDVSGSGSAYDKETILKWLKKFFWRFFSQQFKRSCMPDGPKISQVSFSPRGDFRMPSDAKVKLWMDELERL